MLDWASSSYSKSTNLPSKPHAIIALNKSDHMTAESQWSSVHATADLLESTNIAKNTTFMKHADMWKTAGVHVRTMNDLLERYYSTVHVVRLPDKSRLQRMHDQRGELYQVISQCCEESMEAKRGHRMLPDVDEFGLYLSLAFDQFSTSLDKPFDYMAASLKYQPPSATLSASIIKLAQMVAGPRPQEAKMDTLFNRLTPIVSSILMLDSARKQRIGRTLPQTPFGFVLLSLTKLQDKSTIGLGMRRLSRQYRHRTRNVRSSPT